MTRLDDAPWLNRVGFNANGEHLKEPGKCSWAEFTLKREAFFTSDPYMSIQEAHHKAMDFYKQEKEDSMKDEDIKPHPHHPDATISGHPYTTYIADPDKLLEELLMQDIADSFLDKVEKVSNAIEDGSVFHQEPICEYPTCNSVATHGGVDGKKCFFHSMCGTKPKLGPSDKSVEPDDTEFFGPESEHVSEAVKSDGGSSSYYELHVRVPAGDCTTVTDQLIDVKLETGDVIRSLVDNDFDLGNVIKALRRLHLAANGKGKVGTDVEYDCKKVEYFMKNWYKNYQKDQL